MFHFWHILLEVYNSFMKIKASAEEPFCVNWCMTWRKKERNLISNYEQIYHMLYQGIA